MNLAQARKHRSYNVNSMGYLQNIIRDSHPSLGGVTTAPGSTPEERSPAPISQLNTGVPPQEPTDVLAQPLIEPNSPNREERIEVPQRSGHGPRQAATPLIDVDGCTQMPQEGETGRHDTVTENTESSGVSFLGAFRTLDPIEESSSDAELTLQKLGEENRSVRMESLNLGLGDPGVAAPLAFSQDRSVDQGQVAHLPGKTTLQEDAPIVLPEPSKPSIEPIADQASIAPNPQQPPLRKKTDTAKPLTVDALPQTPAVVQPVPIPPDTPIQPQQAPVRQPAGHLPATPHAMTQDEPQPPLRSQPEKAPPSPVLDDMNRFLSTMGPLLANRQRPNTSAASPSIEIGQIEVVVHTPKQPQPKAPTRRSAGRSDSASRLYLRNL